MKHQEMTPRFDFCFSGPERIPAGAALGRAAATIRIFPAPLPGADLRTPAAMRLQPSSAAWCPPPSVRTEIEDLHAAVVLTCAKINRDRSLVC